MNFQDGSEQGFADAELSVDAFLGGRLQIAQPRVGYRAGVDPVLLAASVPAKAGARVLELGCGGGVASLCLARRVDVSLTGVDVQQRYAALAVQNAKRNGIEMSVHCADLTALPAELRQQQFDHVLANPPYYDRSRSTVAREPGRETGLGEATPLALWLDTASKRLAPGGGLTMIQRADRLPDMLGALPASLGSAILQPFAPRRGKPAHLIILQAKKGGRADFRLNAPIVMHQGDAHSEKGKDYNPLIEATLREGAALDWSVPD